MEKRPLVVLLGDSVLIEGVAASLGDREAPEVIHVDTPSADIHERLESLEPDLVVFELDSPYASPILSLLKEHPGLTLVGLDLTCSRAIVLNSQPFFAPSLDELVHMIELKAIEGLYVPKGGK
jgi:hypothetical protein